MGRKKELTGHHFGEGTSENPHSIQRRDRYKGLSSWRKNIDAAYGRKRNSINYYKQSLQAGQITDEIFASHKAKAEKDADDDIRSILRNVEEEDRNLYWRSKAAELHLNDDNLEGFGDVDMEALPSDGEDEFYQDEDVDTEDTEDDFSSEDEEMGEELENMLGEVLSLGQELQAGEKLENMVNDETQKAFIRKMSEKHGSTLALPGGMMKGVIENWLRRYEGKAKSKTRVKGKETVVSRVEKRRKERE